MAPAWGPLSASAVLCDRVGEREPQGQRALSLTISVLRGRGPFLNVLTGAAVLSGARLSSPPSLSAADLSSTVGKSRGLENGRVRVCFFSRGV